MIPNSEGPAAAFDTELKNRSLWTLSSLGIKFGAGMKPKVIFGPKGAAPAIMTQFAGAQCVHYMMLSPKQYIEIANYMGDPRLEIKTFQSMWPVGGLQ